MTHPVWRWGRRALQLAVLFLLVHFGLPLVVGARSSADALGSASPALLLAGLVLQAGSLVAYAQSARVLLPREHRPGLVGVLRVQLPMLAVTHVLPGGVAASTPLGYRLFRRQGVPAADTGFLLSIQGIGSSVVLNLLLWVALLVSVPIRGFQPVNVVGLVGGGVLVVVFGGLVWTLSHGDAWIRPVIDRVERRSEGAGRKLEAFVTDFADRFRLLRENPAIGVRAGAWAGVQWLLDCASLWVFLAAVGIHANPDSLFVAYGLATLLQALPLTPGGIGVEEAFLTSSLVSLGYPSAVVVVGVLAYRLAEFWLPIPVGGLAYLSFGRARALST